MMAGGGRVCLPRTRCGNHGFNVSVLASILSKPETPGSSMDRSDCLLSKEKGSYACACVSRRHSVRAVG